MIRYRQGYRGYKINFLAKFIAILSLIFFLLYFYIDNEIRPYVRNYSMNEIEFHALEAINEAIITDLEINSDNYKDIAILKTNDDNELIALSTDTYKINKIKTSIMKKSDENLDIDKISSINIPIGNLYNNIFFFSKGLEIPVKIIPMTTTKVDFASSFESVGINQSLHKLIMECTIEIKIIMPHDEIDFNIEHKIALSETLVLGDVPQSYTYIEDVNSDTLDKFNHYSN